MPTCNGTDRGCNITPRESGQTSLWSGVTREPGQQTSGSVADLSAAATLAGAAPNRGDMGMSAPGAYREGLFRQAAAARDGWTAPWYNSFAWGVSNSPTADRGVTAHQRETGSDHLPRGGDGLHRPPPAAAARAVAGGPASCEGRLPRLELHASERCPCSS
jgi:hypothetical protein